MAIALVFIIFQALKPPLLGNGTMKNTPFELAGVTVKPGTQETIEIPLAATVTHDETKMTVHVIHGKKPGPCLFVSAAIHGDEINGVEIIRRLVKLKQIRSLSGTLIAIPIVNVHGFVTYSRYLPDGRDLNRCFPGSRKGSLAGRMANTFFKEIVQKCSHGIDLHTGARHRENLPQIRADMSIEEVKETRPFIWSSSHFRFKNKRWLVERCGR